MRAPILAALLTLAPLAAGAPPPPGALGQDGAQPSAAPPNEEPPRDRPTVLLDEGYVGPESCAECHARNHASWSASYHGRMTQRATPDAVLAPFDGTTPVIDGVAWNLSREGERLFVAPSMSAAEDETTGQPREVVLTTGSHHYQIYWLAARPGFGMDQLPLVWHRAEQRWVPRTSMFLMPRLPAGTETGRWEGTCIKCHTTNGTQQHPAGGTRVAAFGISCEACHGPAAEHVAWHRDPAHAGHEAPEPARLVDPSALSAERSTAICSQCHAIRPLATDADRERWKREGFAFRPGGDAEAERPLLHGLPADNPAPLQALLAKRPELLAELFWDDGEVRVSGREFNGLAVSRCYLEGGASCLACHEMHPAASDPRPLAEWADDQLRPGARGPRACLECHAELAADEALRAHAHHEPGTPGSDCLDCHMPYTTYGLTKAIRSHRIASPSVAAELATGRPNACNLCHLDRSLGWTADRLAEQYGHERPVLGSDEEEVADVAVHALRGDAGQRALAAWALGWERARRTSGTGWMPYLLSTLLLDEYDAVRWVAQRSLRRDPDWSDFALDFTAPLEDQRNQVRRTVLTDWLEHGLEARADRRAAVLVTAEGKLDEPRFRALYAERDLRPVRLSE